MGTRRMSRIMKRDSEIQRSHSTGEAGGVPGSGMQDEHAARSFDEMASGYDQLVSGSVDFPYEQYSAVLDEVVREAAVQSGMRVLDLGTGTGNLAERFVKCQCDVWGIDVSEKMLVEARRKLPGVNLIRADLLGEWPGIDRRFDRVVSSYAFHHFDLATKVGLLQRIAKEHLMHDGRIVIADIVFATREDHDRAATRFRPDWDDSEYYWTADEAIAELTGLGLHCRYKQVSSCGGVLTVTAG